MVPDHPNYKQQQVISRALREHELVPSLNMTSSASVPGTTGNNSDSLNVSEITSSTPDREMVEKLADTLYGGKAPAEPLPRKRQTTAMLQSMLAEAKTTWALTYVT